MILILQIAAGVLLAQLLMTAVNYALKLRLLSKAKADAQEATLGLIEAFNGAATKAADQPETGSATRTTITDGRGQYL